MSILWVSELVGGGKPGLGRPSLPVLVKAEKASHCAEREENEGVLIGKLREGSP